MSKNKEKEIIIVAKDTLEEYGKLKVYADCTNYYLEYLIQKALQDARKRAENDKRCDWDFEDLDETLKETLKNDESVKDWNLEPTNVLFI